MKNEELKRAIKAKVYDISLGQCGLSVRVCGKCYMHGFATIGDLFENPTTKKILTRREMSNWKDFSEKYVTELVQFMRHIKRITR